MVSRRKKDKKKRLNRRFDKLIRNREYFAEWGEPYGNSWQKEFDRIERDGQFCGCCGEKIGIDRDIAAHVCGKIICSYCSKNLKNKVQELLDKWDKEGGHILIGGTY